jgi:Fe-S cluster assembly ATPase SufC
MLVGPTGGGKTCNYRALAGAMTLLNIEGSVKYNRVSIPNKSLKIILKQNFTKKITLQNKWIHFSSLNIN